jgi:hypothetical protein
MLDFDPIEPFVVKSTRKKRAVKPQPKSDLDLDLDFAALKGLPEYGYYAVWGSLYEKFRVFRVNVLSQDKTHYTIRLDRLVFGDNLPKKRSFLYDDMADFLARKPIDVSLNAVIFTNEQFFKWYRDFKKAHLETITQETFHVLPKMLQVQQHLDMLCEAREEIFKSEVSVYDAMQKMNLKGFREYKAPKKNRKPKIHAP